MPPLELHPTSFRASRETAEYDELSSRVNMGEMQKIDLGKETLFFGDDDELEFALPAYAFETDTFVYATKKDGVWMAPEVEDMKEARYPTKKGWLKKVLGR
jgi:hypothetical protein